MICIVKSRGTKSLENNLVLFDKVHFIEEGKVRNVQFHLFKMGLGFESWCSFTAERILGVIIPAGYIQITWYRLFQMATISTCPFF